MLRTIEEENEVRAAIAVTTEVFVVRPSWIKSGLQSGFGGEILLCDNPLSACSAFDQRIKCSKTGREGTISYDGSVRSMIIGVEWDDEVTKESDEH